MVFLLFFTRIHPPPSLIALVSVCPPIRQTPFSSVNPTHISPRRIHAKTRRWDSNAETFRTQKFDFDSIDDDGDDDFEDDDTNQWLDILEDFIDVQVFRSFGWMLPAIISSLLLTSGPKAFLMALAIPIGQSALSLAFQMVWGRPKNKTKRRGKSKSKRKPPPPPPPRARTSRTASYADMDDQQRKRAGGYETWVAGDDKKSNGSSSSFGGWEELDEFNTRYMHNSNGKGKTSKSNLSRRERRSETPLLLRLLIAVFPFLGSWTKML